MRRNSPPFPRNRDPILDVLRVRWNHVRDALEVASGPGEHACYFAAARPGTALQPSDQDPIALASIDAWREHLGVANVLPALHLDVDRGPWPEPASFDGVITINFVHMVGPETVENFLRGVARVLRPDGVLTVYDCFSYDGVHVSASNERFDAHLRASTPAGRVYEFRDVDGVASSLGLVEPAIDHLPANNQCVTWRRAS